MVSGMLTQISPPFSFFYYLASEATKTTNLLTQQDKKIKHGCNKVVHSHVLIEMSVMYILFMIEIYIFTSVNFMLMMDFFFL